VANANRGHSLSEWRGLRGDGARALLDVKEKTLKRGRGCAALGTFKTGLRDSGFGGKEGLTKEG